VRWRYREVQRFCCACRCWTIQVRLFKSAADAFWEPTKNVLAGLHGRTWLAPHYPPYWHYDILQALLVLSRMGRADDPRASDARDELQRRRLPDGRWQAEYRTSTFLRASAQAAAVGKGPATSLIVERRFVRVGAVRGERVAIVEGVRAGERVVTAGQIKLQANMPVTIDESAALPAPAETPRP